ncbi:NAD-dependent epimerase/dehydratase family protein [Marinactinospora thermotolerans]|uniref:NAD-dependent epimerase/dehydratase family protein n=1 Tax=Marinactinospora thermotolerans TaxID=531310 RepID=UPI003D9309F8
MRVLILGGTDFLGPAVVEEALARGHEVTVFHRGRQAPPPGVEVLRGDRTVEGGLTALSTGGWDVAVDTWSGAPSAVRDTARLLSDRVGHYVYVSSRSVHPFPPPAGAAEDAPVVDSSPDAGEVDYAHAKRGGELAVERFFGERALSARAGLILGPHENVGRLPWWLSRIARGGRVPTPGPRDLGVQYVDVRDLAAWLLEAAGRGLGGAYNLVGPPDHTTIGELLETCVQVTGAQARLCWLEPQDVLDSGVEPWTQLPIWMPPGKFHDGMHRGDVSRALAEGLRCRPVAETVADTWAWLRDLDGPVPQRSDRPRVGLDARAEERLLRRWEERESS